MKLKVIPILLKLIRFLTSILSNIWLFLIFSAGICIRITVSIVFSVSICISSLLNILLSLSLLARLSDILYGGTSWRSDLNWIKTSRKVSITLFTHLLRSFIVLPISSAHRKITFKIAFITIIFVNILVFRKIFF